MRVAIGADHAGFPLKAPLTQWLSEAGYEVLDLGTDSTDPVDYPDIARAVSEAVLMGDAGRGIVLCGSAQGASIAANKLPGIRAAVGHDTYSAHQSVEHDDANVLCVGARVIGPALAVEVLEQWLNARYTHEERHARRLEKIRALEDRHSLVDLQRAGQSAWMDNIQLDLLASGAFRRMITDGITGVTSNPTIMEKSISSSRAYDPAIRRLARQGKTARDIALALWADDIREASTQLLPVHELTEAEDGYASIEVDAELAYDTEGTVKEGRRLWHEVNRPNVMIKVPATTAGLPAIEQLIAEGINVNITLLFSQLVYEQVMDAYLNGLERWFGHPRGAAERPPASVASFFVSRVDSKVDSALRARFETSQSDDERQAIGSLLGKAAIANARLAYQRFRTRFSGPRWEALAAQGARVQRPLWASTSTKDPSYRDVLYVEQLIGPDTVNTMPPQTIEAFQDHGYVSRTIDRQLAQAEANLAALSGFGIDLDQVTEQLQQEGVEAFATSFDALLQSIAQKREAVLAEERGRFAIRPGEVSDAWRTTLSNAEEDGLAERIWKHDPTVWSGDPEDIATIEQRLGWLDVVPRMRKHLAELAAFVESIRADGMQHVVLLGMGGSSLAPEVWTRVFGSREGYPRLVVLDTTDPVTIASVERSVNVAHTLFVVASKSGTTIETRSHFEYFWERTGRQGRQFVAITDPGTPLAELAADRKFRHCFANPADIGGRYSALSYFGLVPAALIGVDLEAALTAAEEAMERCRPESPASANPGLTLGTLLGAAGKQGRDKVTILTEPELRPFGLWVEQLLAESTGKLGIGLVPIAGEDTGPPDVYGNDRVFVSLGVGGNGNATGVLDKLAERGHAAATLRLPTAIELIGECFTWEFATASAGAVLGINPFNEPNVQEAKDQTRAALAAYERDGRLPAVPSATAEEVALHIRQARPGDYLAILAYLPYDNEIGEALQRARMAARDAQRIATSVGFGPRYLHSTGQLHKGGPNTGVFVQITGDDATDIAIPGAPYTFGVLKAAQAVGDYQALAQHNRRVIRYHVGGDSAGGIRRLTAAIQAIN